MSSKFFKTGNATRSYKKDGLVFNFEPLIFANGTWIGALEEKDEERAAVLADYGPPVKEITEEEFLELKKKPNLNSHISEISEPTQTEPTQTEQEVAPAVEGSLEDSLDFKAPPADEGADASSALPTTD